MEELGVKTLGFCNPTVYRVFGAHSPINEKLHRTQVLLKAPGHSY